MQSGGLVAQGQEMNTKEVLQPRETQQNHQLPNNIKE